MLETVDEVLLKAGVRAIAQDPDEQWPVASSIFEASEHAEKRAYAKLPLSLKAESTNDIAMMILATELLMIANLYPADALDKRTAMPKDIPGEIMPDLTPHCEWAHIGSEQVATGLFRAVSNWFARVITLPASTIMSNELPTSFRIQVNGITYQVYTTMMPCSSHAYGNKKERINVFKMPTIMPSLAESLCGADTSVDCQRMSLLCNQLSRNRGVDNCSMMLHAKDQALEDFLSTVVCEFCVCPNIDLLTVVEMEHIMCPWCQKPTTITKDLMGVISNVQK